MFLAAISFVDMNMGSRLDLDFIDQSQILLEEAIYNKRNLLHGDKRCRIWIH